MSINHSLTPVTVTVEKVEGEEVPKARTRWSWKELDEAVKGLKEGEVLRLSKPEGVEWKHFINMVVAKGSKWWKGKMRTRKDGEVVMAWRE